MSTLSDAFTKVHSYLNQETWDAEKKEQNLEKFRGFVFVNVETGNRTNEFAMNATCSKEVSVTLAMITRRASWVTKADTCSSQTNSQISESN